METKLVITRAGVKPATIIYKEEPIAILFDGTVIANDDFLIVPSNPTEWETWEKATFPAEYQGIFKKNWEIFKENLKKF